jgi:[ribosomal protein S5]-alanine N-acetyltransferase
MRVQQLHFVEIGANGTPAQDLGALSQCAADACAQTVAHYRKAGFSPPWISFLARCDPGIVGVCAFTSAPSAARVEIAYHTFPPFQGQGIATAMVKELLRRARQADPKVELFAHTLPEHNASTTILRKLGFEFLGKVTHPEELMIWEWRRKSI